MAAALEPSPLLPPRASSRPPSHSPPSSPHRRNYRRSSFNNSRITATNNKTNTNNNNHNHNHPSSSFYQQKKYLSDGDLSTLITHSTCANTAATAMTTATFGETNYYNYNAGSVIADGAAAAAVLSTSLSIDDDDSGDDDDIDPFDDGEDCGILTASRLLAVVEAEQRRKKSWESSNNSCSQCDDVSGVEEDDDSRSSSKMFNQSETDSRGDERRGLQQQQQQDSAAATDEFIFPQFASITDTLENFDDDDEGKDLDDLDPHKPLLPKGIPLEVLVINDIDENDVGNDDALKEKENEAGDADDFLPTEKQRHVSQSGADPTTVHVEASTAAVAARLTKAKARIRMYENLVSMYRKKIKSSDELTDSLNDYLRQTQGYADDLLNQRSELVETIEEMERDDEKRNDQETLCLVITSCSLVVYFLGGSHQFLVAAVMLQLVVGFVNTFI